MPISGVWMWPQSVSQYGANKVVKRCVLAGITDIFFLTKGLAGTASYSSAIAPHCSEHDLLSQLLRAAHAHGVRVHAWLTSASDEHYKSLYPNSGRCHYTRGKDKGLISLADPGYLAYMEQIVRELCREYAIDGLHLDYIRYNHLLYGWSEDDQARYAASGADVSHLRQLMDQTFLSGQHEHAQCIFDAYRAGDQSTLALARTRRHDVLSFASTLTHCARAENSRLILSAALMPEGAYADTAFADLHYGQSYADAALLYDYVLPMAYSKAYGQDSVWVRSVAEGTLKHGLQTVMGLHAYDGGTGPSLAADLSSLAQTEISGTCLFRYGAFALGVADGSTLRIVNTLDQAITSILTEGGKQLLPTGKRMEPGSEEVFPLSVSALPLRIFCGQSEACIYIAHQHEYTNTKQR